MAEKSVCLCYNQSMDVDALYTCLTGHESPAEILHRVANLLEYAELRAENGNDDCEAWGVAAELGTYLWSTMQEMAQIMCVVEEIRKSVYRSSSEKLNRVLNALGQLQWIFADDADHSGEDIQSADPAPTDTNLPALTPAAGTASKQKQPTLSELMKMLPAAEIVRSDDNFPAPFCPNCGSLMDIIGHTVYYELVTMPPQVHVRKIMDPVFGCRNCDRNGTVVPIIRPEMSLARPIPNCLASAETLAWLIYQKVALSLPLYRMERFLADAGVPVSRTTLGNWLIGAAMLWLTALAECMRRELVKQDLLHADETPWHVLKEPGREATAKGYVWLYCSYFGAGVRYVLLDYQASHAASCPQEFLAGFAGTLVCDGYSAYVRLASLVDAITLAACWAHCRREWVRAVKSGGMNGPAGTGFEYVEKLFMLESEFEKLSNEDRLKARVDKIKPLLDEFHKWLETQYTGSTQLGKAVKYTQNHWDALCMILTDGRIPATNAAAELIAKNCAVGRKNFLFSDTRRGADALMACYSVVETAKANDLNAYEYLLWIFRQMPEMWRFVEPLLAPAMKQIDDLTDAEVARCADLVHCIPGLPDSDAFPRAAVEKLIVDQLSAHFIMTASREVKDRLVFEARVQCSRFFLPEHAPPECRSTIPKPERKKKPRKRVSAGSA